MVICHCSYMQKVTKTLHVAYTCTARSCMNFHEDLFKLHALVTCKMWLWNLYHKYSINHILPMKNYLKNILKNNVKNFWNSKFHVMNFDSSWNGNPFPPILITHVLSLKSLIVIQSLETLLVAMQCNVMWCDVLLWDAMEWIEMVSKYYCTPPKN